MAICPMRYVSVMEEVHYYLIQKFSRCKICLSKVETHLSSISWLSRFPVDRYAPPHACWQPRSKQKYNRTSCISDIVRARRLCRPVCPRGYVFIFGTCVLFRQGDMLNCIPQLHCWIGMCPHHQLKGLKVDSSSKHTKINQHKEYKWISRQVSEILILAVERKWGDLTTIQITLEVQRNVCQCQHLKHLSSRGHGIAPGDYDNHCKTTESTKTCKSCLETVDVDDIVWKLYCIQFISRWLVKCFNCFRELPNLPKLVNLV